MIPNTSTALRAPGAKAQWADLLDLSFRDLVTEYARPAALLWLELLAWKYDCPLLGCVGAFFFFLAGLRLAHDTFHGNLGVGHRADRLCLWVLSTAMLGSMHAVRRTHLRHHRFCLGSDDVEAAHAGGTGWQALAYGPLFPIRLHRAAWQASGRSERLQISLELALNSVLVAWTLNEAAGSVLKMHVTAMIVANWLTAFFAVWTVHRDCHPPNVARTLRNRLKSKLAMDMFYHEEHHRFPRVPTIRLGILARRLDEREPGAPRLMVY